MISPLSELRQKITQFRYARGVASTKDWVERETQREQLVDWVSGACLLVRREDAEAAGLLDERYFLYTEDVDFCAAIRQLGRNVLFTPAVHVVHLGGRSRATVRPEADRAYRLSQIAFYEKHHPMWAPLLRAYLRLKGQLPQ
jgi:GT2 family glycosyltransferase